MCVCVCLCELVCVCVHRSGGGKSFRIEVSRTKLHVFQVMVMPVLLYGVEMWAVT